MPASPDPSADTVVRADDAAIARAVDVLRGGGLVAVPTETVYGLAVDARNPDAVAAVFAAKGRPADHPLIVHLPAAHDLVDWVAEVPDEAALLAEAFWPGPLTIVLPRHASVLDQVTGGRTSVAVRVPAHPVARRLLGAFGGGLAAPSANRFGRVSPTTAADVLHDLGRAVDLVLDGGPCDVGLESTVIEIVDGDVEILRPGGVPAEALAAVIGRAPTTATGPSRAPGMLPSHYAPTTPIVVCDEGDLAVRATELAADGRRIGVLSHTPPGALPVPVACAWDAGGDTGTFARSLYGWLRRADAEGLDVLIVAPPPATGLGVAVRDRLARAARR